MRSYNHMAHIWADIVSLCWSGLVEQRRNYDDDQLWPGLLQAKQHLLPMELLDQSAEETSLH